MEGGDANQHDLQLFHNTIREYTIFLLLFILLYILSYALLWIYRRRDRDDYPSADEDEATVYRISVWLCTFSLAVSVGAALLLPISIVSNEVLLLYPKSYYVQWLNISLIQGLWNLVFLFSNLSLFILLPFAYLFTESEGFTGYRKGIKARVYETSIVLLLLAVLVLGMTYIMSALIDKDKSSIVTLLNIWNYYLPFLYSCISFLGVLMLLLCTPLGFARLFTVVGRVLVKPQFLRDVNEEFYTAQLEEESLSRTLKRHVTTEVGKPEGSPTPMVPVLTADDGRALQNGALKAGLRECVEAARRKRIVLDKLTRTSSVQRNLMYPLSMVLLLALTAIAVLMVLDNVMKLLVGLKTLPLNTQQFSLGLASLSKLGWFGAAMEVVVIIYLMMTSYVGLYTLPFINRIRPRLHGTPISHIILNCGIVLILSSALPLLARILGITDFDLLGDFGRIEWLGNFKIVLFYNVVFAVAAALLLVNKFSATLRQELCVRFKSFVVNLLKKETQRHISWMSGSPAKED